MGFLAFLLIWPLLLLTFGFVFISGSDIFGGFMAVPIIVVFLVFTFGLQNRLAGVSGSEAQPEDADRVRRGVVAFSIALLLPIFVKYMLDSSGRNLQAIILGLVLGFGILLWGMFIKNNNVLAYANMVGGGLVVIYLYFQIWSLGQLAQIVASAFGLLVAVIASVIKFREKLT